MTVANPALKAFILSELSALGSVLDPSKQDTFAQALANVITNFVIPNMQIAGATGSGPPGGPLPIALPPGAVT